VARKGPRGLEVPPGLEAPLEIRVRAAQRVHQGLLDLSDPPAPQVQQGLPEWMALRRCSLTFFPMEA
jgi:hypothetical protein